jgi:hypothetical protein
MTESMHVFPYTTPYYSGITPLVLMRSIILPVEIILKKTDGNTERINENVVHDFF